MIFGIFLGIDKLAISRSVGSSIYPPQHEIVPSLWREQVLILPAEISILSNSGGGSVVVVAGSAVVGGVGWGVGIADCTVVLGSVGVKMVSGGAVGCVVSLLVAQAVAVSATMARTGMLRRCLIRIAWAVLMSSDNSTH